MNTFIVEGRRFDRRLHAITFAREISREADRSVDVKVETVDFLGRRQRSWMCRMHPPGKLRTVLGSEHVGPPEVYINAVSA